MDCFLFGLHWIDWFLLPSVLRLEHLGGDLDRKSMFLATARGGRGETFLLAGVDSRPCRHRSSQLLLELAFEFFTVV